MKDMLAEILSPIWCFSVVIMGIIVGVIANRSDRLLDRVFGGMLTRWRDRSEARKAKFTAEVARLRESAVAQREYIARICFTGLFGVIAILFGVIWMAAVGLVYYGLPSSVVATAALPSDIRSQLAFSLPTSMASRLFAVTPAQVLIVLTLAVLLCWVSVLTGFQQFFRAASLLLILKEASEPVATVIEDIPEEP